MKAQLKPFYLYVPITRISDEERIVEGYVYVNAIVGDGIDLTREAMEAATADYLRFGAVREMHQMVAAGTALSVVWDENGAFIRAHIVDDAAWKKVKANVYKAFSVGIRAKSMRGNKVTSCEWIENSLVDRPADPDAVLTSFRADGIDPSREYEVEILPEETPGEEAPSETLDENSAPPEPAQGNHERMENENTNRGETPNAGETPIVTPEIAPAEVTPAEVAPETTRSDVSVYSEDESVTVEVTVVDSDGAGAKDFAQTITDYNETIDSAQVYNTVNDAIYTLFGVLDNIYYSDVTDKAGAMKTSIQQFADYLVKIVGAENASEAVRSIDYKSLLSRLKSAVTDATTPAETPEVQRALETTQAETNTLRASLASANGDVQRLQGEIERLKNTPKAQAPTRYPHAVNREFAANADSEATESTKAAEVLRSQYATLAESLKSEEDEQKRNKGVQEMQRLKMAIHTLGE